MQPNVTAASIAAQCLQDRIVTGKEPVPILAIFDSVYQTGTAVLVDLVARSLARQRPVTVLCLEYSATTWRSILAKTVGGSAAASPHLNLVDLSASLPATADATYFDTRILPALHKHAKSEDPILAIIDAVDALVQLAPRSTTLSTGAWLTRHLRRTHAACPSGSTLAFGVGADTFTAPRQDHVATRVIDVPTAVRHLAMVTIDAENAALAEQERTVVRNVAAHDLRLDLGANDPDRLVCRVTCRKTRAGKYVAERNLAEWRGGQLHVQPFVDAESGEPEVVVPVPARAPDGEGEVVRAVPKTSKAVTTKAPSPSTAAAAADPAANLSFNLRLTDRQREARERVVLPYMAVQHESQLGTAATTALAASPTGGGATIFYEYDVDDDFDDDDPDADLEI
ncbi:hypothetical protein AMAG_13124 [Allomyces macrogynus ATCC 38327]|uniref:Elongator complex protein 5 n=1 Tax=Allomyces macrogynus (strain ATCC 38327) TaxID=578462 RepID=A0A0L0SZG4_ALLM3|nr:hypothetical protein AMAG_13124 [Allomyces macrogynus ATCC 38327]|eukprot:KNE67938.1 hypothetical protein AMAG_13124 [Allomyces macrogynus ATCC 38327]